MTLPVPKLDDQSWPQLVRLAADRMKELEPQWTADPHDPAMVLIDVFAHLTDILLYRLNRVPEKMYSVFLNYIGAGALHPASAATTTVRFSRTDTSAPVTVPAGTRVTLAGGAPATSPVFVTLAPAQLDAGGDAVEVDAVHAELHDGEYVGLGTGSPGQVVRIEHAPAIAGEVRVAVEDADVPEGSGVIVDDRTYRYWTEVATFVDAEKDDRAFVVDRVNGEVSFAPALARDEQGNPVPMCVVPASGRSILAWYSTGGGRSGNLPEAALTMALDPLPDGVSVTNPAPATGGEDVETVEEARQRAPQEFHLRQRAVTARDYELLARAGSGGAVARARAFTRRELWEFAQPGEVEVVLVPAVPRGASARLTASALHDRTAASDADEITGRVRQYLQGRAPLGASCVVRWADYKTVAIKAVVVIRPDADPQSVRQRILAQLDRVLTPIPSRASGPAMTAFGQTLRASNLNRLMEQADPAVRYVQELEFRLKDAPDQQVACLARDGYQPQTWFTGSGDAVYRTVNGGDGWELTGRFPGLGVVAISPHPSPVPERSSGVRRPGLVALLANSETGSHVLVSRDLGDSWQEVGAVEGELFRDLAWAERRQDEFPRVLLAGDSGLWELVATPGGELTKRQVDPAKADTPLYAVKSFVDLAGRQGVLVAAQAKGGLWLTHGSEGDEQFHRIRAGGEDVRRLGVQYDGPITYLWAARADTAPDVNGCARLRVDDLAGLDPAESATRWQILDSGWVGGECWDLSFGGGTVFAATQQGGVLRLDLSPSSDGTWKAWAGSSGLPLEDQPQPLLVPVQAVSCDPSGAVTFAGGAKGIFRHVDTGNGPERNGAASGGSAPAWRLCSGSVLQDAVTLPLTWLFLPGDHEIDVRAVW